MAPDPAAGGAATNDAAVAGDHLSGDVAASARSRKFRQAAFVYLHVGILYEFAAVAMWRAGMFPSDRGPVPLWLVLGAAVTLLVVWLLWVRQNRWVARAVWALHGLRLPTLIGGAFFPDPVQVAPPSFYLTALVVVIINLAFLARAGWDL